MENENNQLPLEENQENAAVEQTAPLEEMAPAEMKKGIQLTPGKLVGLIVGVVVLVAVLVGAVVAGMGGFGKTDASDPAPTTEATVAPTYAADTGLNDVTHKGTYTVSDEKVLELADQVVATVGESVMTVEDLQVYYWMQVQNFFYNYSYYLHQFGLDYHQPLDTQVCNVLENGYTWQQYFLASALYNWHNDHALANAAKANDTQISGDAKEYLDTLEANLKQSAATQGFADVEQMLAFNFGPGASLEAYTRYEGDFILGNEFYTQQKNAMVVTAEEMEKHYAENEQSYVANGVTRDAVLVDVRHILIAPEGKNPGDEYTEEEWAAIEKEAQAILDGYLAGEKTEEAFGELANEHSADNNGNVTNGGLYEDVYKGMMVSAFDAWCFDASRQPGDTGLVKTEFGYHIMYFVGSEPIWESTMEADVKTARGEQIVADACDAYPMEVDYSAIVLGEVNTAKWFGE